MITKKEIAKHIKDGGFFVGSKIVSAYTINEETGLVGILYSDESQETCLESQWEAIKDTNVYPEGQVSERRFKPVLKEISKVLLENLDEPDVAVRGILELMMKERCDLNSYQFVLQLLAGSLQAVIQGVTNNVNDTMDQVVCRTFDVATTHNVLLSQAHEMLEDANAAAKEVKEEVAAE